MIELSRNEKERNYSDGVLIAALVRKANLAKELANIFNNHEMITYCLLQATLRKLVSICGDEAVRGLEADDLIQPRLLDSFLLYSSRQESYV